MAKNVYGNSIDIANSRGILGDGYNYIDTSAKGYQAPTSYGDGLVLGGVGAIGGVANSDSAIRLSGANRQDTANAIQNYANANRPQTPVYDPSNDIRAMNESRKASAISGLQGAYNNSMNNYNQQDAKIDPQAYQDRSNTSTSSQLGARSFAEYLANRNQSASGFGNQSELNRGMQLQNDIGGIDLQARNAHNGISNDKTNLSNALQNDIQSSNAGIEASGMQQLIEARQAMEAQKLSQANTDRSYNYQVGQDNIQNTGRMADGSYTQAGQANNLAIQMNQLGLSTARLNLDALPQQLKSQAQQIAQELQRGSIDLKTAQLQLDYLPRQQAMETAQNNARIASTNRANTGSGGGSNGGSSSSSNGTSAKSLTANQIKTETKKMAVTQEKNGTGTQWLNTNKAAIIKQSGSDFYNSLIPIVKKTKTDPNIAYKNAKAISQRKNGNSQRP